MKGKKRSPPRRAKPAKAKGPTPRESARTKISGLQKRLAAALKREAETSEQQMATSEILRVISRSRTDLQSVLDAVAENAARLCHVDDVSIIQADGGIFRVLAYRGAPRLKEFEGTPVTRGSVAGRAILDGRVVHIPDVTEVSEAEFSVSKALLEYFGHSTMLATPLLREGASIGAIFVRREKVQPFSDKQIELLQTFADQAVIAIENVRLFRELAERNSDLTESLERQTATAEILQVISASPTGLEPVFNAILHRAVGLCHALHGVIYRFDGEHIHIVAHHNYTPEALAVLESIFPARPGQTTVTSRAILERVVITSEDASDESISPSAGAAVARQLGYRAIISVPMLRDGTPVGTITMARRDRGVFDDKQVALLKIFADQAVIAIENVRLFTELQASNRELTTALDTQTATGDILRVISSAQTNVQPVFDAILSSALRLLGAYTGALTRVVDDRIELAALASTDEAGDAAVRAAFPQSLQSEVAHARAIRDRVPFNMADAQTDPRRSEAVNAIARARGFRSLVAVPLLRHETALGAIAVSRREPGGFTDDEIALLQTFADQAVIAIDNVRLFTELQASNRELATALDTQTATSDVLRVISRSQTDVQPVFQAIVDSAQRLLHGHSSVMSRIVGDRIELAAYTRVGPTADALLESFFPVPVDALGRPIREIVIGGRVPYNVADTETDPRVGERGRTSARARGYRSQLVVPMLRQDDVIGTIAVTRAEPGAFTDDEIALLQTFADQAVIAIENARLFNELQARNRELTTALDTQTATSDILRVISGSQTDVTPVFDAIVQSARRLLGAAGAVVFRRLGDEIHLAALTIDNEATRKELTSGYPVPFGQMVADNPVSARAWIEGEVGNIADAQSDPRWPERLRRPVRAFGVHGLLIVPMRRAESVLGVITVMRRERGLFSDDEIALLQTFADQAVIAIENARLLTELQARTSELTRSVGELTALGEVGRALSSTLDMETVLQTIVLRANELTGTAGCTIWEYDATREEFRLRASDYVDEEDAAAFQATAPVTAIRRGQGVTGQVMERRGPVQIHDLAVAGAEDNPIRRRLVAAGHRALLAVPLLREDEVLGVLVVTRKAPGEFRSEVVQLLSTFATQSALAVQNARLFREIELKSRELEVTSQHKSEFLASMSHELRTPLNAIIGFSDVLLQGMFGEMTDKQTEYLRDILSSGQHLLSLINDILDLSKIEAGRMELDLADFHLPSAIDDALLLMRERASRRGLALDRHVDERLGEIRADQRKLKQVLLNLLSNAVKFTPEGGRIEVRAAIVDGTVEISVTDTGIGIAPEDQEAVFEEFRQVGTSDKKAEGTGLGLALCRKFVELHGGRLWVKSATGQGSTFTFALPLRPRE